MTTEMVVSARGRQLLGNGRFTVHRYSKPERVAWGVGAFIRMKLCNSNRKIYVRMNASTPHTNIITIAARFAQQIAQAILCHSL